MSLYYRFCFFCIGICLSVAVAATAVEGTKHNSKKQHSIRTPSHSHSHLPITVQAASVSISSIPFFPLTQTQRQRQKLEIEHENDITQKTARHDESNVNVNITYDAFVEKDKENQENHHRDSCNSNSDNVMIKITDSKISSTTTTTTTTTTRMENNTVSLNGLSHINEIPIHNDLFEGKMILIVRANPTSNYAFGGDPNIMWELQMQGKFKRTPGPLYLSVEIPREENFRMSWAVRAIANAFCKLIQFFGYDLHKSLGDKEEIAHFASPAIQGFDKFVATNTTHTNPPKLGQEIEEPHESCMQRRKFEFHHIIDTSLMYTMSFNDTFFDPSSWTVTNIPIFKSVDMSKFANSLRLVLYEVDEEDYKQIRERSGNVRALSKGKHTKRNIAMFVQMHNPHKF